MTQTPQEYEDKGFFVQFQHCLIYGYPELSRDDKWVLLAIMGKCWEEKFYPLSYRAIANLAKISLGSLSSMAKDKIKEGIIDRLVRYQFIQTKEGKDIDPITGKEYGNAQTFIKVNYQYLKQLNIAFCARQSVQIETKPVHGMNEPVHQVNTSVHGMNEPVHVMNEPVHHASSNEGLYIPRLEDGKDRKDSLTHSPNGNASKEKTFPSSSKQESLPTNPVAPTTPKKEIVPRKNPRTPRQKRAYQYTLMEQACLDTYNSCLVCHEDAQSSFVYGKIQELARKIEASGESVTIEDIPDVYKELNEKDAYWQGNVNLSVFLSQFSKTIQKIKKPQKPIVKPTNGSQPYQPVSYSEASRQGSITLDMVRSALKAQADGTPLPDSHKSTKDGVPDCPHGIFPPLWFNERMYRNDYYSKVKTVQAEQQPVTAPS